MKNMFPMALQDCVTQLIWANERLLETRHLKEKTSFKDATVCWRILEGGLTFESEKESIDVKAGEWIFPAAVEAVQHFEKGTRLMSLRFLINLPGGSGLYRRKNSLHVHARMYPGLDDTARVLIRGLQPWADRGSLVVGRNRIPLNANFQIEAFFYQWMAVYTEVMHQQGEQMRSREKRDSRVAEALQRLDRSVFRQGFSDEELAESCGLSVNQLALLFKKETGVTPFQYYDRLRLENARVLLEDTGLQVKEIAYELGFSSSPHFTNWFKQREGCGPRVFRNTSVGRI